MSAKQPGTPDGHPSATGPNLGLVCVTTSDAVRYRTITLTNYRKLQEDAQLAKLRELYAANIARLLGALDFCHARGIRLYRMTSQLFPMSDLEDGLGLQVLQEMTDDLATVGARATQYGIRVVVHPDQFVVLSSDSPRVVENSEGILAAHARNLDLMGLPRSAWSMILIHGGKGGRAPQLTERIESLPENVRTRIALENDEHVYGAGDILRVCRASSTPMVFDAHHHVIKEKLGTYEDPSVQQYVDAARGTWPDPDWQIVHISNGRESFLDRRHSDLITDYPSAFATVPWVEVEAKGKEEAIADLRGRLRPSDT